MKYIFLFLCMMLPVFAHAEVIESFVSDITIQRDGSFTVEESISYDFEGAERHGIYRDIAKVHPQKSTSFWKTRAIDVTVLDVTLDGSFVPYELSNGSEVLQIKIGDPNATLTGLHTYTITYTVFGGLSYFNNTTGELYWNVTGNNWTVPIRSAVASISSPFGLFTADRACYTGLLGDTTTCDEIRSMENGVEFEAFDLAVSEGLSIAQSLDTSSIEHSSIEHFNFGLVALIVLPLGALFLFVSGYRYRTKYKTGNTIIAQYEPYEDFKPMYTGMLFDGSLDPQDITAGIVYLAEQGFLKIRKIEGRVLFLFEVDDYEITFLRPLEEVASAFLQEVMLLLYPSVPSVGDKITLSQMKKDTVMGQKNLERIAKLRKDLKKDMHASGFYETNNAMRNMIITTVVVAVLFVGTAFFFPLPIFLACLFAGLFMTLCFLLVVYERRTKKAYEAIDHLKGFKLFLTVTDAERFKFHDAPQKSPEQFMEYLPYAIAFGVEKQWAKVFEDITIPNPAWYDSGSTGAFTAAHFTSSIGAFSSSFTASSGTTASSGGGASGGGGGGGGGGSW